VKGLESLLALVGTIYPDMRVTCPRCGHPPKYQRTLGHAHLYQCKKHGTVAAWPSGVIRLLSGRDLDIHSHRLLARSVYKLLCRCWSPRRTPHRTRLTRL
jgi:hypothetical protein